MRVDWYSTVESSFAGFAVIPFFSRHGIIAGPASGRDLAQRKPKFLGRQRDVAGIN